MTTAINSLAMTVIRYAVGIIGWIKVELERLDRKTRKLYGVCMEYITQKHMLIGCTLGKLKDEEV